MTAALLGWVLLGERLPPRMRGAIGLIGLGLWLSAGPRPRRSAKRQPAPG